MSKFLKHIFLISGILFTIFSALGYMIDQGLKKTGLDNFPEWSNIQKGIVDADIIIAGNSRAWVNVSPYILDTALNSNTYNLGLDGHLFHAQYIRFKFYSKFNSKPHFIIHC